MKSRSGKGTNTEQKAACGPAGGREKKPWIWNTKSEGGTQKKTNLAMGKTGRGTRY